MKYLNTLVSNMKQINSTFVPERELFVGSGTNMAAISIGHGFVDGSKMYIAKKIPTRERIDLRKNFLTGLWCIDLIAGATRDYGFHKWDGQLPLVYGIEFNGQEPTSIITQDYSRRNAETLFQVRDTNELHPYLLNVIQQSNPDLEELCGAGFRVGVNGPVKLGDFDTYANPNLTIYKRFLNKLRFEYSRNSIR